MQQDSYNMPGVIDVRYLQPDEVPAHIMSAFLAGVPVAVYVDGTQVSLNGEASVQSTEEHSNNGRTEKATLTFQTVDDVPRGGVAWLVKQASGDWWLIGSRERVYPTVKVVTTAGEPGGDRAVKTVTVEYQSFKAIIPVDK